MAVPGITPVSPPLAAPSGPTRGNRCRNGPPMRRPAVRATVRGHGPTGARPPRLSGRQARVLRGAGAGLPDGQDPPPLYPACARSRSARAARLARDTVARLLDVLGVLAQLMRRVGLPYPVAAHDQRSGCPPQARCEGWRGEAAAHCPVARVHHGRPRRRRVPDRLGVAGQDGARRIAAAGRRVQAAGGRPVPGCGTAALGRCVAPGRSARSCRCARHRAATRPRP